MYSTWRFLAPPPPPLSPNVESTSTSSPQPSPSGDLPAPLLTASFDASMRRRPSLFDEQIIKWIQPISCGALTDFNATFKQAFPDADDKVAELAHRAFEVFKDPDSMFASHRAEWGIKVLVRLAVLHMQSAILDEAAMLSAAENVKRTQAKFFSAHKSKSKGSLELVFKEINLETVLRYVRNNQNLKDIHKEYDDSPNELDAALKMHEVLFDPNSNFAKYLGEWSDERKMIMAKRHAMYPMTTDADVQHAIADEDAMIAAEQAQAADPNLKQFHEPRASEYGMFVPVTTLSSVPEGKTSEPPSPATPFATGTVVPKP